MIGRPIGRTDHGESSRPRPGTARRGRRRVRRRTTHRSHQQQRTSRRSRPIRSTPASHIDSVNGPAIPWACRPKPQQRCVCLRTDQKVGGSNPSGRAPQIRCAAAFSAVRGDLATRSHPFNRPIDPGRRPLGESGRRVDRGSYGCAMRDARGDGSLRQRRPGVREVRVAVGPDPVSGRSRYRSLTVRGTASRRRRPGSGGRRRPNWCGHPGGPGRASHSLPSFGSGSVPTTGGDRRRWPGTGQWRGS